MPVVLRALSRLLYPTPLIASLDPNLRSRAGPKLQGLNLHTTKVLVRKVSLWINQLNITVIKSQNRCIWTVTLECKATLRQASIWKRSPKKWEMRMSQPDRSSQGTLQTTAKVCQTRSWVLLKWAAELFPKTWVRNPPQTKMFAKTCLTTNTTE